MTRHGWVPIRHGATVEGRLRPPLHRAPAVGAEGPALVRSRRGRFLPPVTIYLFIFYAYPLYRSLDLSFRNYTVRSFVHGHAPFSGLANYRVDIHDPTFTPALLHTLIFTVVSIVFQFVIGLALAVFFVQHFRLSATLRALFLVPWLLPLIVSASTWSWMLNSDSGVVNSVLHSIGIAPVNWLTAPKWALVSVIIANIWIGIPFNLVLMYSGLQANLPRHLRSSITRWRERLATVLAGHLSVAAARDRSHFAARASSTH